MIELEQLLLIFSGVVAGMIDSIAGGGGLITLPVLSAVVGPGAAAIGTNKIVGTAGALIAFLVYFFHHQKSGQRFPLKASFYFLLAIAVGSACGASVTPFLSVVVFRYLLLLICPLVLWVLWHKASFMHQLAHAHRRSTSTLVLTGLLVGFYDGFFGPGGGTFMLFGLLWAVRLPLLEALLVSKLANTISAAVALVAFQAQGYIHWPAGLWLASGMTAGGFVGASLASKRAEKVVRPVLTLVVLLLLALQLREMM